MHDIKEIRKDPDKFFDALARRGGKYADPAFRQRFLQLDKEVRLKQKAHEDMQAIINKVSKMIGQMKGESKKMDKLIADAEIKFSSLKSEAEDLIEEGKESGKSHDDMILKFKSLSDRVWDAAEKFSDDYFRKNNFDKPNPPSSE